MKTMKHAGTKAITARAEQLAYDMLSPFAGAELGLVADSPRAHISLLTDGDRGVYQVTVTITIECKPVKHLSVGVT